MSFVRLNIPTLLILLFIGNLFSNGSFHLGTYFSYLYWFFLIFILLDFVHLMLSFFSLRYHQDFSTDHPQKNDILYYSLSVKNEGRFPSARVYLESVNASPAAENIHTNYTFCFPGRGGWKNTLPVRCSYRGIYTVGIKRLVLSDLLGIFRIGLPVWQRTFYVYPRVRPLPTRFIPRSGRNEILSGDLSGNIIDPSYFSHLSDYRPGEDISHIYWKKYSVTGLVHLKQYDRTAQPGIELYIDRRPVRGPKETRLKTEDLSIEIALSLITHFNKAGTPVVLHLSPDDFIDIPPDNSDVLKELLVTFLNLRFSQEYTILEFMKSKSDRYAGRTGAYVCISHVPDLDILEYILKPNDTDRGNLLYLNGCAFTSEQHRSILNYVYSHGSTGREVFIIGEERFF